MKTVHQSYLDLPFLEKIYFISSFFKEADNMSFCCSVTNVASLRGDVSLLQGGRSTSLLTADRSHRHPCCINLWSAIASG